MFTVDDVRAKAGQLVDMIASTSGDRIQALATVARTCGIQLGTLKRFIGGKSKENGLRRAIDIREAYRTHLKQTIAETQAELKAIEDEDAVLDVWDIDQEIAALEQKFIERKEMLKNANSR